MAKRTAKKTKKKAGRTTTTRKKATTRKRPAKKAAKRTASRTSSSSSSKPPRITAKKDKPRTKSEVESTIAEHVGISKKEVDQVFEVMQQMIAADLKKGSVGVFNVPGMMKVTVQRKPATKARKGTNPFTGEETVFKAKPARNVVKVRPLKKLKDLV